MRVLLIHRAKIRLVRKIILEVIQLVYASQDLVIHQPVLVGQFHHSFQMAQLLTIVVQEVTLPRLSYGSEVNRRAK